jgi:SAM-dependent methyltransferase
VLLHLDNVPPDVQALLAPDQLGQHTAVEFLIYQCHDCGLVQAPVQLKSNYYDDYLMSTTFSDQLRDYLDGLAAEFIDQFELTDQSCVLDVGCGDGAFMYPFRDRGIQVAGIEPSERSRTAAAQAGFTVHAGYLDYDTVIPGAPFDAFVSRQVFEHVDDISALFVGIRRNLKPEGVGIIEVPRLEKAIEDQRFYDFFPDHVNYYSIDTLRLAAELNGFEVIAARSTMFDEYNTITVRVRPAVDLGEMHHNRAGLIDGINSVFAQAKQQGSVTAVWGAGAKGLSIMTNLDTALIDHLIDSDPNKVGRYTAISELLIESSDILTHTSVDVIVITAVAYQQSILKKLREQYQYTGQVYVLQKSGIKKVSV